MIRLTGRFSSAIAHRTVRITATDALDADVRDLQAGDLPIVPDATEAPERDDVPAST